MKEERKKYFLTRFSKKKKKKSIAMRRALRWFPFCRRFFSLSQQFTMVYMDRDTYSIFVSDIVQDLAGNGDFTLLNAGGGWLTGCFTIFNKQALNEGRPHAFSVFVWLRNCRSYDSLFSTKSNMKKNSLLLAEHNTNF